MKCGCGCGNRYSTNNVNVCINVTKVEGQSGEVEYLKGQVKQLSGDLAVVSGDLYELSGKALSSVFTDLEIQHLKTLAEQENFEALTGLIERYDSVKSVIYQTQIITPGWAEITDQDFALVSATIQMVFPVTGEIINIGSIKDVTTNTSTNGDTDNDPITQAKIPISGFILGMWINQVNENDSEKMEKFVTTSILYQHETDLSEMFLTREQIQSIYNDRSGKIKVCALKLTN